MPHSQSQPCTQQAPGTPKRHPLAAWWQLVTQDHTALFACAFAFLTTGLLATVPHAAWLDEAGCFLVFVAMLRVAQCVVKAAITVCHGIKTQEAWQADVPRPKRWFDAFPDIAEFGLAFLLAAPWTWFFKPGMSVFGFAAGACLLGFAGTAWFAKAKKQQDASAATVPTPQSKLHKSNQ